MSRVIDLGSLKTENEMYEQTLKMAFVSSKLLYDRSTSESYENMSP
jgi:hypothetical protein